MVRTKQDILCLLDQSRTHLQAMGVKRIGLFGSFVRGEQNPDSDIDLLVEFEPGHKTFDGFMELSFFLEKTLERRVELVTLESLSPYLGPHILREVEYASVAEDDIRRRFSRSIVNFWGSYRSMADRWHLFYNGGAYFHEVALGEGTMVEVCDETLFALFLQLTVEVRR